MIFGGYSKAGGSLPAFFQISIARFSRELPGPGEPLSFLVAIHEEGTGITWQQNITVEPDTKSTFLETTETLYRRGLGYGGGTLPESALAAVDELGRKLWETFLGDAGTAYLADGEGMPLLLDVDKTHAQPAVGADGLERQSAGAGIPVRRQRPHPSSAASPATTRSRRTPRPVSSQ